MFGLETLSNLFDNSWLDKLGGYLTDPNWLGGEDSVLGSLVNVAGPAAITGWALSEQGSRAEKENKKAWERQKELAEMRMEFEKEMMALQEKMSEKELAVMKKKILQQAYESAIQASLQGGTVQGNSIARMINASQAPLIGG